MNEATVAADAARRALKALAEATAQPWHEDQTGTVLASLSAATDSLSECLHQIAAIHDTAGTPNERRRRTAARTPGADYPMSWELHRAGEILHQVSTLLHHARTAALHQEGARLIGEEPSGRVSPVSPMGLER